MTNAGVPVIPQDIINCIIEAVDDDTCLLQSCALVSSSFLLPSRKRLFSKISLNGDGACQRLYQFLVDNPVAQSFIRSIAINCMRFFKENFRSASELNQSTSLIAVLQLPFHRLESFSFSCFVDTHISWKDFSNELKDALSTVIHSNTLKRLRLYDVVDVPLVLFQSLHLTYLKLDYILPSDFDREHSTLLTPAASNGGAISTVIDRCEWGYLDQVVGGFAEPFVLPFLCRLRVFEIHVHSPSAYTRDLKFLSFVLRSLHASLTTPATLEHLKFNITFEINDFLFIHNTFLRDLCHNGAWRHLESIVTHATGSRLQRVDVNIDCTFPYYNIGMEPNKTEVEKRMLDALPLLRKKGILFVTAHCRSFQGRASTEAV